METDKLIAMLARDPQAVARGDGRRRYLAALAGGAVGAMLLMLAIAWRHLAHRTVGNANPLMVFGRTSLFVYWVHVELAYGSVSYPLRNSFALPGALAAYAVFTAAMYGLAVLWLRRAKQPLVPERLRAPWRLPAAPRGVAGPL